MLLGSSWVALKSEQGGLSVILNATVEGLSGIGAVAVSILFWRFGNQLVNLEKPPEGAMLEW